MLKEAYFAYRSISLNSTQEPVISQSSPEKLYSAQQPGIIFLSWEFTSVMQIVACLSNFEVSILWNF